MGKNSGAFNARTNGAGNGGAGCQRPQPDRSRGGPGVSKQMFQRSCNPRRAKLAYRLGRTGLPAIFLGLARRRISGRLQGLSPNQVARIHV
jgi:hypothetical protein